MIPADEHTAMWTMLTRWATVLSIAMVASIGLGAWGFIRASSRSDTLGNRANVASAKAVSAQTLALQLQQFGSRLGIDEHASCLIQARGLPAGHQLVGVLADLHRLLTLPPTSASRARARSIPRWELRIERHVVKDLNHHLAVFGRLERSQPPTISCP